MYDFYKISNLHPILGSHQALFINATHLEKHTQHLILQTFSERDSPKQFNQRTVINDGSYSNLIEIHEHSGVKYFVTDCQSHCFLKDTPVNSQIEFLSKLAQLVSIGMENKTIIHPYTLLKNKDLFCLLHDQIITKHMQQILISALQEQISNAKIQVKQRSERVFQFACTAFVLLQSSSLEDFSRLCQDRQLLQKDRMTQSKTVDRTLLFILKSIIHNDRSNSQLSIKDVMNALTILKEKDKSVLVQQMLGHNLRQNLLQTKNLKKSNAKSHQFNNSGSNKGINNPYNSTHHNNYVDNSHKYQSKRPFYSTSLHNNSSSVTRNYNVLRPNNDNIQARLKHSNSMTSLISQNRKGHRYTKCKIKYPHHGLMNYTYQHNSNFSKSSFNCTKSSAKVVPKENSQLLYSYDSTERKKNTLGSFYSGWLKNGQSAQSFFKETAEQWKKRPSDVKIDDQNSHMTTSNVSQQSDISFSKPFQNSNYIAECEPNYSININNLNIVQRAEDKKNKIKKKLAQSQMTNSRGYAFIDKDVHNQSSNIGQNSKYFVEGFEQSLKKMRLKMDRNLNEVKVIPKDKRMGIQTSVYSINERMSANSTHKQNQYTVNASTIEGRKTKGSKQIEGEHNQYSVQTLRRQILKTSPEKISDSEIQPVNLSQAPANKSKKSLQKTFTSQYQPKQKQGTILKPQKNIPSNASSSSFGMSKSIMGDSEEAHKKKQAFNKLPKQKRTLFQNVQIMKSFLHKMHQGSKQDAQTKSTVFSFERSTKFVQYLIHCRYLRMILRIREESTALISDEEIEKNNKFNEILKDKIILNPQLYLNKAFRDTILELMSNRKEVQFGQYRLIFKLHLQEFAKDLQSQKIVLKEPLLIENIVYMHTLGRVFEMMEKLQKEKINTQAIKEYFQRISSLSQIKMLNLMEQYRNNVLPLLEKE